jgi:nitrite reductase/ring-hydroxylating ferredoxin subunit
MVRPIQNGAEALTSWCACKIADVSPGGVRRIEVPGRAPIAIFNVAGTFYATDDTCTHGQASLADGVFDEHVIECPFHAGTFDVRSGDALTFPCVLALSSYPVRIEGSDVVVLFAE